MPSSTMLSSYAQTTALKLVYNLSRCGVGAEVYDEPLRILQQAKEDLEAGRDPLDRLENVNGWIYEI